MSEPEHGSYGLVMPFVVCDPDGPYDANSFVAGAEFGFCDGVLRALRPSGGTFSRWVYPALVPQLDLLAMHHGYSIEHEPWDEHPDEWERVTFVPPGGEVGPDE